MGWCSTIFRYIQLTSIRTSPTWNDQISFVSEKSFTSEIDGILSKRLLQGQASFEAPDRTSPAPILQAARGCRIGGYGESGCNRACRFPRASPSIERTRSGGPTTRRCACWPSHRSRGSRPAIRSGCSPARTTPGNATRRCWPAGGGIPDVTPEFVLHLARVRGETFRRLMRWERPGTRVFFLSRLPLAGHELLLSRHLPSNETWYRLQAEQNE